MYWESGDDKRILFTAGSFLYAVDAITGKSITTFGDSGRVDLHEGLSDNLDHDVKELSVTASSPGVIYKNTRGDGIDGIGGRQRCTWTHPCL